ncbi:factor Xa inhibitor BuXI-like [Abrus precatorius]|uniref:Factor Xa inhibitor BuXI-like n=1 Tax=Abrus precatorius TaxID=3816 RepID=A0A8B8LPT6_ABRPR|nr:factor Xa inhibitor BuXI-like [Abrus precatorius]
MKTINSWLTLLFLLFASTKKLKFAIASGVHDTDGSMVENGGDYYILPSLKGEGGGGVTLASIGVTHPLAIVQSPVNSLGLPVSISNINGTMIILTDDILSINFTNSSHCNNSCTWMLVMDDSAKVWYLGIGSAVDYPSHQIKMGRFQIKEFNLDYKLVFCSDSNTPSCEDVGIYIDSGKNRRLALSGAAFSVRLKNADKYPAAFD